MITIINKQNMTLVVEPVVNMGTQNEDPGRWLGNAIPNAFYSAHFEQIISINRSGPGILTKHEGVGVDWHE